MPLAAQLAAKRGDDATLLKVASMAEKALGFSHAPPLALDGAAATPA